MRRSSTRRYWVEVTMLMSLLLGPWGCLAAQQRTSLPEELDEVWKAIKANYVSPVLDAELARRAIAGLLAVDPYGEYLDEQAFRELQVGPPSGTGGVGLELDAKAGRIRVMTPIDGGPASGAGLLPNDLLLRVDDSDLVGRSLSEAVSLLWGKFGTQVKLTVQRPGEPQTREFRLTRRPFKFSSVTSKLLSSNLAYVRIRQFGQTTPQQVGEHIDSLLAKGEPRALVLDIRSNPGGLLSAAIAVATMFVSENALVVTTDGRSEDARRQFRADGKVYLKTAQLSARALAYTRSVPMAVLIDSGTASGSEIVAAALRDHKRATVVGETSFGLGTIKTIMPLGRGTAIKLTTAMCYTPAGRAIDAFGIEPNIVVDGQLGPAEFGSGTDKVLGAAVAAMGR